MQSLNQLKNVRQAIPCRKMTAGYCPVYVLDWYCFHDRLRKNFQLKAVVLPGYHHIEYIGYAVNCQKHPKHSYG